MKRAWITFLVCAALVAISSPFFWWLTAAKFGAAPGAHREADGAQIISLQGPKAYWPDWVVIPESARVSVRLSYSAAPGHPAIGYGDMTISGPRERAVGALTKQLNEAGWSARSHRVESVDPTIPPRPLTLCFVVAMRERPAPRTVTYTFALTGNERFERINWTDGPRPAGTPGEGPPC